MEIKEIVVAGVKSVLKQIVEQKGDEIIDKVLLSLVNAIPGQVDNVLVEKYKVEAKALAKSELLKLIAKINIK